MKESRFFGRTERDGERKKELGEEEGGSLFKQSNTLEFSVYQMDMKSTFIIKYRKENSEIFPKAMRLMMGRRNETLQNI